MTDTAPNHEPSAEAATAIPPHPSEILLSLIVAFLTPMFLTASSGNIHYARLAAIETVNAYRAQTQADLIAIAQIVAFGLAALASLSLSMSDNISLPMILRLRANANACNRAAEQNRRALQTRPAETPIAPPQPSVPVDTTPVQPPSPPKPAATEDRHYQAMWAAAAGAVAAEYTADLANLPPADRPAAAMRAAMLNSCANDLLIGQPIPHLRPEDLAGFIRQNSA